MHKRALNPVISLVLAGALVASAAHADDSGMMGMGNMNMPHPMSMDMGGMDGGGHGTTPAGMYGVNMVGQGHFMLSYTPMYMDMKDNYIGSKKVSPETIATTVPSGMVMGGMPVDFRVIPTSMHMESHMFHVMYGVTDWLNVMAMTAYQRKSMDMVSYAPPKGTNLVGESTGTTSGLGDTAITTLWRLYKSGGNELHFNLGVSLPTGSTDKTITMISPMNGKPMTMRASYGMQLGTGTRDLMPGVTYLGHLNDWSWGATWRGRYAMDMNDGYKWGNLNEFNLWGGYTWVPGFTTTLRLSQSHQNSIYGMDKQISGGMTMMEGQIPANYGGSHTNLFVGAEFANLFGVKHLRLALEAGDSLHQNLNGPQMGQSWQIDGALGIGF